MLPVHIYNMFIVEEEERRAILRQFNAERRLRREQSDPFLLTDVMFKDLFRLTKDMCHNLIEQVVPHMDFGRNSPLSIEPPLRVFTALYFFATGSYQRSVGQSYNLSLSQQSVSLCVNEVSQLIVNHLAQEWIVFPNEEQRINRIKGRFMDVTNFPGVIGAIDCTHVSIIAPRVEEHNYVNRKDL